MILLLESVPKPDLILETVNMGWPSTSVYRCAVGVAGGDVPTHQLDPSTRAPNLGCHACGNGKRMSLFPYVDCFPRRGGASRGKQHHTRHAADRQAALLA